MPYTFNERWYLSQNPDVAAAVGRGEFASAAAHFAAYGALEGRYPSLFFSPQHYLDSNPDVAEAVQAGLFRSAYDHYTAYGYQEWRSYSSFYSRAQEINGLNVTVRKLFDADYYTSHNPDVAAALARGTYSSALDHYLQFGVMEERAPSLIFSPIEYLSRNADVQVAKAAGSIASALHHLLLHGQEEVRQTSSCFDGGYYLQTNPDVAVQQIAPLQHFLTYGALQGRSPASGITVSNQAGNLFTNGQISVFLQQGSVTIGNGNGGTPANVAPVAIDDVLALDENSANSTVVGTVIATDANAGDTLTYAITAGNTGSAFAINAATGQITVADSTQLDYETLTSYTLTVTVTDNGTGALSDTATITINLNDVNEAPVVASALADRTTNSGSNFSYTFAAASFTDVDAGDSLTYTATLSNGAALPVWLSFNGATRTFSGTPGGGDVGAITVRVRATDTGALSVTDDFDVTVSTLPAFINVTAAGGVGGGAINSVGVAWNDYDSDGDQDLYVANTTANFLYRNNSDGTFTEVGAAAGVDNANSSRGVAWGDYDNDGDADLYLTNWGGAANFLYRNNGNGTFSDVSGAAGIVGASAYGTAWFDYNGDGNLDVYVNSDGGNALLYRNNGNGTFSEDAVFAGVSFATAKRSLSIADFDADSDLDIYIGSWGGNDNLFYMNNGDGTFTNINAAKGMGNTFDNTAGVAWGDYDGDGDLDLFLANYAGANTLYRNNNDGTFTDIAVAAGLNSPGSDVGAVWGDYDADGDLDLYLTREGQVNSLYRNNSDSTFTDVAGVLGVDDNGNGYGTSWMDYDNDGDLDLYVSNFGTANLLYENQTNPSANSWFSVDFDGGPVNGITVQLYQGAAHVASRLVDGGSGYASQSALPVYFSGLSSGTNYTLRFTLPDGTNYSYTIGTPDGAVHKVMVGGSGADSRTGSAVEDLLIGQGGNDTLNGAAGQDRLTGGAGSDVFVFSDLTHSTNMAADLISDFTNGSDSIDLTGLGFTSLADFETLSFAGGITTLRDTGTNFTITFTGDVTALLDNTDFIW